MTVHGQLPQIPEADRLRILRAFDVLDTPPEQDFDDLVDLAAHVCQTPLALVSLVEADRQWFKARTGTDLCETPIGESICAHVVEGGDFLEIHDTQTDPRTALNPLCTGPDAFRFYAGAPLVSSEGAILGTLCVLDRRPRRLTPPQRKCLRILARQAVMQMELRRTISMAGLLRREIDHRVKNSLQSLSALTRVEAAQVDSDEVKAALRSIDSKINSVALVHDQLYRTGAAAAVELEGYLENLVAHLRAVAPQDVAIEARIDPATVDSRKAAALGMLVNEVVSNAVKHAFPEETGPGRTGGTIRLRLERDGDMLRFEGRDDGVGLATGRGAAASSGFGMKIARAVGSQLGGELEIVDLAPGVAVRIAFPMR